MLAIFLALIFLGIATYVYLKLKRTSMEGLIIPNTARIPDCFTEQQRRAQMAQRAAQETTAALSQQKHAEMPEDMLDMAQSDAMKREEAVTLKAARLEQAAITLQRRARMRSAEAALAEARARMRAAEAALVQVRAEEAELSKWSEGASMLIQNYARRWLEAQRLRRLRAESVYGRVRAHWLRMSRRGRRLQRLAIRWRALADAVLEAPSGAPAGLPMHEAVGGVWQVVWRSIGSPAALRIAPPARLLTYTLLCRVRLAALARRPRPPRARRSSPSGAFPTLAAELRAHTAQLRTQKSLSYRSPSSPLASGRWDSSSPDLSRAAMAERTPPPRMLLTDGSLNELRTSSMDSEPIEAAPMLHSFRCSPDWSRSATAVGSPEVRSRLPRTSSLNAGVSQLRTPSMDHPRASARHCLPPSDQTSMMPQAQRLPPPERRVPAASSISGRATTAHTTLVSTTVDRSTLFADDDASTPPAASSAGGPHAGCSRVQPSAIRQAPTLSECGGDASHTSDASRTGAAMPKGRAVPNVIVQPSSRSRSEVVQNRVPNVTALDVGAGALIPSSGASASASSARRRRILEGTREGMAAWVPSDSMGQGGTSGTKGQRSDRSVPPAVLSKGRSASVHV